MKDVKQINKNSNLLNKQIHIQYSVLLIPGHCQPNLTFMIFSCKFTEWIS